MLALLGWTPGQAGMKNPPGEAGLVLIKALSHRLVSGGNNQAVYSWALKIHGRNLADTAAEINHPRALFLRAQAQQRPSADLGEGRYLLI
ncbi:hypothetical protein [Pseudomonas sp. QD4]|uniref:hypothetical protein n=1 Tax=Pseudomonas sp. QD4 TaxID=3368618 RepID=UPI003BA100D6